MSNENKDIFDEENSYSNDEQPNNESFTEEPFEGFTDEEAKEEEYTSQFGELEEFLEDYDTVTEEAGDVKSENTNNTTSTKKTAIIAVVAVLLVAVIALGAYFLFFDRSIKFGVWVPVTLDEKTNEYVELNETIKEYYKFTDTEMTQCFGNEYATSITKTAIEFHDNTLKINDSTGLTVQYSVSGNMIKGKYLTLVIPGYEKEPITYKWTLSVKMPKHKGPEFKKNDSILGYWVLTNDYGEKVYKEFTEDGTTNEYTAYKGTEKFYSQKYNFDGENIITLSPGGQDVNGQEITSGTEDKNKAVLDGDTLTLYQYDMPFTFKKSSKEDYEKYRDSVLAGTYEYPTADLSQYQIPTEIVTTELTTEAVTEAVTE